MKEKQQNVQQKKINIFVKIQWKADNIKEPNRKKMRNKEWKKTNISTR